MIGRNEPLDRFASIRWAREMAAPQAERRGPYAADPRAPEGLRPLEAHVLLLLATYADDEGKSWPSIKLLGERCGLKVTERKTQRDKNGKE